MSSERANHRSLIWRPWMLGEDMKLLTLFSQNRGSDSS